MNKETSNRVSTIAAAILQREPSEGEQVSGEEYNDLLIEAKTLAGSCLSQDEHKGQTQGEDLQNFGDVLFRLKHERDELEHTLISLNSFLHHNRTFPAPNHRDMLDRQSTIMSEYLSILDERITDLEIARRSDIVTTENIVNVEDLNDG